MSTSKEQTSSRFAGQDQQQQIDDQRQEQPQKTQDEGNMYATFEGESAGNKADEVQTLEGASNSAIKPAGATRGETHEISTIK